MSQGILLGLWEHQFHRGMEAQLTGVSPRHSSLLPFAGSLSGAACISSCRRINWQLNVLLLIALSREMKLFAVL